MTTQIDETDRALIALLARDARSPVATLARRLDLARSTVQARLERLERAGVIAGYTLRLGADARPAIRATALLSVEAHRQAALVSTLEAIPEVEVVHTTSGRFDLMIQIGAPTTEALDAVLDRIHAAKGVKSSESLIHLTTRIDRRPL
ncbi:Lrp/AsnC family transcriptional regulator [Maritimibacter alkaliphilus]|uniref:Lrp/AsnC family transcriptional regulator n=1 Tax=Maritimibacter alkaliphilus TaxID=404236 RepID=UPI001C97F4C0|nr:Lrp/AsnC family transcriptional regulator [Maritimibacter alkaliphilus]MBY6089547.1 Lrp/AsnC family transcriptional regulator [Maritimibacter alkaliphilus]